MVGFDKFYDLLCGKLKVILTSPVLIKRAFELYVEEHVWLTCTGFYQVFQERDSLTFADIDTGLQLFLSPLKDSLIW